MSIQFAAIHERNSWRKHSRHTTLQSALTGDDGAENLLRNRNRAPAMNMKYGQAHAVVVWDDSELQAIALRLKPGSNTEIERTSVPIESVKDFRRHKGPSQTQISKWFSSTATSVSLPAVEGQNQGATRSRANAPSKTRERQYRHGNKPNWEIVLEAVLGFNRPVSLSEVGDRIVSEVPDFKRSNLVPDLSVLSVNCFSRGNHAVNRAPRRTDTDNPYDKLIRIGKGKGVRFTAYDPNVHGVWALADVGEKVLRPRFLGGADSIELERARCDAEANGMFNVGQDERRRIIATIVQREGQPAFRKALLEAYGGACSISGCRVESLLEAAHIVPYRGAQTNLVRNGLLLRADLHKLFDLHLFRIDPATRKVHLSETLKCSEYAEFEGASLREPLRSTDAALTDALKHHEERCGWMNASANGAPLDNK